MSSNSGSGSADRAGEAGRARRSGRDEPRSADATPAADQKKNFSTLGKFQIERQLGAGGMGTVYLALDTQLKRRVALKVLSRDKAENPRLVKRFHAEAQAAAHLRHENIVSIYEAGEAGGYLFIALEYVDGTDVQNLVSRRGPIPIKRSIDMIRQVAAALEHAHQRGIIHRDIKPSNLLIRRNGMVKLTDLGLARSVDDTTETGITRAGTTVGTVDYMAPEQARDSKAADVRSDLYSLGCTWYYMLTGSPPFPDGSVTNKLHAHAIAPPPDPQVLNRAVPEAVIAVLHRMMAKSPEARYQTPAELLEELEHAHLTHQAVTNDVLAALADDAPADAPAVSRQERRPDRESSTAAQSTAEAIATPPKRTSPSSPSLSQLPKRKPATQDESQEPRSTFSLEPVKFLVLIAVLAAFAGLYWWISTRFADSFDDQNLNLAEVPFRHRATTEEGTTAEGASSKTAPDDSSTTPHESPAQTGEEPQTPEPNPESPTDPLPAPARNAERIRLQPVDIAAISLGREAERQYMPVWAAEFPERETNAPPHARGLPVLTVGRTDGGPSQFATLAAALDAVPASGGVVELVGDGPFFLPPRKIENRRRLILTNVDGGRPLVVLVPDSSGKAETLLSLSRTSLHLIGVHLTAVARQFPSDGPLTLIGIDSDDLAVRHGSVTLLGRRPGRTVAFRVSGRRLRSNPADGGRVLFDRSFVRGHLTALEADQTALDLVASHSLFATGNTPALRLTNGKSLASDGISLRRDEGPLRRLRFVSCTVVAGETAFEVSSGIEPHAPPTTLFLAVNSVFAAEPGRQDRTLLALRDWPHTAESEEELRAFERLQWMVEASVFAGWPQLVSTTADDDKQLAVQGAAGWNRLWRQSLAENQFATEAWPVALPADLASLAPEAFDVAGVPVRGIETADGERPGCPVAALTVPSPGLLSRADAFAHRPRLTAPGNPPETIEVELGRQQDLGRVISGGDWPSGTLFRVSGSGIQSSSPIVVNGKSLRIRFVQTTGSPLIIESRSLNFRSGEQDSFITVSGGNIDIVGGKFRVPSSMRGETPRWFLHVEDGSFSLRNCSLNGPMVSTRYEAALRWSGTPPDAAGRSRPSEYSQYGLVSDSYLAGPGKFLSADLRGRAFVMRNSVAVGLGDLFDLNLMGQDATIAAALDLDHCTLSAGGSFFRVRGANFNGASEAPLRCFVARTVFAPPVDDGGGQPGPPTLLTCVGPLRPQRQIDWYEEANGYAEQIGAFLAEEPNRGEADFETGWRRQWEDGRVLRPLAVRGSVLLAGELPQHLSRLAPTDFALLAGSPAARWTTDGRAIGANIAALTLPEPKPAVPPKPQPNQTKPAPKTPPTARPDF